MTKRAKKEAEEMMAKAEAEAFSEKEKLRRQSESRADRAKDTIKEFLFGKD